MATNETQIQPVRLRDCIFNTGYGQPHTSKVGFITAPNADAIVVALQGLYGIDPRWAKQPPEYVYAEALKAQSALAQHAQAFLSKLTDATAALKTREDVRVLILGDKDADGVTSTALAYMLLRQLLPGAQIDVHMLRHHRSYSAAPWDAMGEADLIFVVDFGVNLPLCEWVTANNKTGRVFVVDHHLVNEHTEERMARRADAGIVDFNATVQADEHALCAAGEMFLLLYLSMKNKVWLTDAPWIAAIGVLGDMSPVEAPLNWALLRYINWAGEYAPAWLKKLTGDGTPTARGLSFSAVPMMNSLARVQQDPAIGVYHLLGFEDNADTIARINQLRRDFVQIMFNFLADKYPLSKEDKAWAVVLGEDDLDGVLARVREELPQEEASGAPLITEANVADMAQGVAGLVAGMLSARLGVPAFVGVNLGGQVVMSARSRGGTPIHRIIQRLRKQGLLTDGGGHLFAGGLSFGVQNTEAVLRGIRQNTETAERDTSDTIVFIVPASATAHPNIDAMAAAIARAQPVPGRVLLAVPMDLRAVNYAAPPSGRKSPGHISDKSKTLRFSVWAGNNGAAFARHLRATASQFDRHIVLLAPRYVPKYRKVFYSVTAFVMGSRERCEWFGLGAFKSQDEGP